MGKGPFTKELVMHFIRQSLFATAIAAVLLFPAGVVQASTLNVPSQYATIQAAINAAAAGDTIAVAAGTYHESLSWQNKDLVIQGAGEGLSVVDPSAANGGPGGRGLLCYNLSSASKLTGFTFRNGAAAANSYGGGMENVVGDLTVSRCTFSGNTGGTGGGVYNQACNPTIADCTFSGNSASVNGGGMANSTGSKPLVENCAFTGNSVSDGFGGGMENDDRSSPTVTDCSFTGNTAGSGGGGMANAFESNPVVTNCLYDNNTIPSGDGSGGGMYNNNSSPTVTHCAFSNNKLPYSGKKRGGGMENYNGSNPMVTDCAFSGNSAVYGGGMDNYQGSPTVTRCTFSGNSALLYGGGMENFFADDPTVINCTIRGNSAYDGAGMYNDHGFPTIVDCVVAQNTAADSGGGICSLAGAVILTNCTVALNSCGNVGGAILTDSGVTDLTNCIVYTNTSAFLYPGVYGTANCISSDVQGLFNAVPNAGGNFTADPLFVDPSNGDLHLSTASPCCNTGNSAVIFSPPFLTVSGSIVDLDGNPRIVGSAIDIGAYELQVSPPALNVPASVNGTVGQAVTFTAAAAATIPGDTLMFGLVNPPSGATIDPVTGQVSFTTAVAGTYNLNVKVTESDGLSQIKTVQAVIASVPNGTARVLVAGIRVSRVDAGTVNVTFNLINSGTGTARNVRVTSAKLKGIAAGALVGPFDIPAGNSQSVTLAFAAATLTPGSAIFTVSGSYTGGSFSSGVNLTLP